MEFRTRHIMFSFQGLLAVILAVYHDLPTLYNTAAAWIPTLIGMFDWISAQYMKYKGIYTSANGVDTQGYLQILRQFAQSAGVQLPTKPIQIQSPTTKQPTIPGQIPQIITSDTDLVVTN